MHGVHAHTKVPLNDTCLFHVFNTITDAHLRGCQPCTMKVSGLVPGAAIDSVRHALHVVNVSEFSYLELPCQSTWSYIRMRRPKIATSELEIQDRREEKVLFE